MSNRRRFTQARTSRGIVKIAEGVHEMSLLNDRSSRTAMDKYMDRLGHDDAIYYFDIPNMGQRVCNIDECIFQIMQFPPNMPELRG
jgi:hypothetical protein